MKIATAKIIPNTVVNKLANAIPDADRFKKLARAIGTKAAAIKTNTTTPNVKIAPQTNMVLKY